MSVCLTQSPKPRALNPATRGSFLGVTSVQLHKGLCLEGPHAWFNALLLPSGNS